VTGRGPAGTTRGARGRRSLQPVADDAETVAGVLVVAVEGRDLGELPVSPAGVALLVVPLGRLMGGLPGLLAAVEHGEQPSAAEQRRQRPRLGEQEIEVFELAPPPRLPRRPSPAVATDAAAERRAFGTPTQRVRQGAAT
jgi:hypothetical protein